MTFHRVPKPEEPPRLEQRYCKACRYCWEHITTDCMNDELRTWDPIKGYQRSSCADNRSKPGGGCGPEGRLWEPRLPAPTCWPCVALWLFLILTALAAVFG